MTSSVSLFHYKKSFLSVLCLAMAGNIIPAIATTNAIIAGLIVMEALKILAGQFSKCKTVRDSTVYVRSLFIFRPIYPRNLMLEKDY